MTNELPPGWALATVGDVAHFVRGVTYSKEHSAKAPSDGLIPVLRATNIGDGMNYDDLVFVPARFVSDEQIVRDGDVVLAMSSGSKSVVGKAAVAKPPLRCGFGAFCGVIRPSEIISHSLLGFYFQTKAYRNAVSEESKGVNINNLKAEHILDRPLPIPPSAEQARIASRIDELFSRIEEGERALERVQKLVDGYRQSVLKAAVTGELTRDWREKNKGKLESGETLLARILKDRRTAWEKAERAKMKAKGIKSAYGQWKQRYVEPAPPDAAELPKLPEGWIWASVDQLCKEFGNGLSTKPSHHPPGIPILRISSVRPLAVDATDLRYYVPNEGESVESFCVADGDLLFTRYNGSKELVGVSGVYRSLDAVLHPDKLIRARVVSTQCVNPDYLATAMNCGISKKHLDERVKTSAGQHGIAGSDIKRAPVPLPSFAEQEHLADLVSVVLSKCGNAAVTVESQLRRAQASRQSILRVAFMGTLVSQDSADEPASALLERIAIARGASIEPTRGPKNKKKTKKST